jgi:uncharacterized membrane protein YheB (UPF0754 family)
MNVFSLILPPVFGFVIGFVTNALAIRMMFRPYEETRFLGFRFQGMIPRRKADIARSVSLTVVSELLREDTVADRIAGPDVRQALEALVLELADRYLGREYGAVVQLLDEARVEVVERAVAHLVLEVSRAGQEWVVTPEGVGALRSGLESLFDRSLGELLRGEEVLVSGIAVGKALELLAAPDLEDRVQQALGRLLVRLAGSEARLGEFLPDEAKEPLFRAVRSTVPTLLRRFEQALLSAENVEKLKGAVRSGIEAYLLETKGGFVKNLARQAALLGRERIFRETDEIVDANLHRLGELVYAEENRARVEDAIEEALEAFLSRTPAELLATLPTETLDILYARIAARVCQNLRRPEVSAWLSQLLEREMGRLFEMPLGELARVSGLGEGDPEHWARRLAQWAAEGRLEAVARREGPLLARAAVSTPLGRPARCLPESLVREITALALDHLMPVVSAEVPEILRIVDVQGLVEREILAFSPRQVETMILGVARRELRAITWWGGLLGTLVGSIQSVMTLVGW